MQISRVLCPFVEHFGFTPRPLSVTALSNTEKHFAKTYFLPPLLRLALTWIWTALVSVFFYPLADSLSLLARTGLTGSAALLALYGSALLDFLLGLAVLLAFRPRLTTVIQLGVIIGYSLNTKPGHTRIMAASLWAITQEPANGCRNYQPSGNGNSP